MKKSKMPTTFTIVRKRGYEVDRQKRNWKGIWKEALTDLWSYIDCIFYTIFVYKEKWECNQLGLLQSTFQYSRTSLIWTPKGQNQVSALQRCPYYRGRECMIFGILWPNELSIIERCPYYRGICKERLDGISKQTQWLNQVLSYKVGAQGVWGSQKHWVFFLAVVVRNHCWLAFVMWWGVLFSVFWVFCIMSFGDCIN